MIDRMMLFAGGVVLAALGIGLAQAAERYGAIAYSPGSGLHGYANDHASQEAAQARALAACDAVSPQGGCKNVLWFREACGALAIGAERGYGSDWDVRREEAEQKALATCANWDDGCRVVRSLCSGVAVTQDPAAVVDPIPPMNEGEGPGAFTTFWDVKEEDRVAWLVRGAALFFGFYLLRQLYSGFRRLFENAGGLSAGRNPAGKPGFQRTYEKVRRKRDEKAAVQKGMPPQGIEPEHGPRPRSKVAPVRESVVEGKMPERHRMLEQKPVTRDGHG